MATLRRLASACPRPLQRDVHLDVPLGPIARDVPVEEGVEEWRAHRVTHDARPRPALCRRRRLEQRLEPAEGAAAHGRLVDGMLREVEPPVVRHA